MKNFFVKLLFLFAFILTFAVNTFAAGDLGITSVVYDNSSAFVAINSFDSEPLTLQAPPKLYIVEDEHKAYFDINSAVLKCPRQDLVINSSDIQEVVASQFSTNPNIVRFVISYKEGFNPKNIQLKVLNNTLFIAFRHPSMENFYFQHIYSEANIDELFEPASIQIPVPVTSDNVLGQINSAFNTAESQDKGYILSKKDLQMKSKYYLDNVNFKNNSIIITGVGSYTISKPMYLSNPSRVVYDVTNAVVNNAIRNKEIKFNQSDSIKIGQFNRNTARIVITTATPDVYVPILYSDTQRLVFIDKLNISPQTLYSSTADLAGVYYEKSSDKIHGVKLVFSKPVVSGVIRNYSNIELLLYNVDKFMNSSFESALKHTVFSDILVSSMQGGGLKLTLPADKSDIVEVMIGSDGKTIRFRETAKVQLSVQNNPTPVIVPPVKVPGKKVVVIDPGHGGSDVGATRNGIYEKNITLEISKMIADMLRNKGYEVVMTRTTDKTVSLQERVELSENSNPDIFVSIHVNSSNSETPSGLETHYYKDNSLELAKNVHASMLNNINSPNRGLFKSKFYVINHTTAPAILVEIGFLSNPSEREQLISDHRKQATAKAIVEGIYEYFK